MPLISDILGGGVDQIDPRSEKKRNHKEEGRQLATNPKKVTNAFQHSGGFKHFQHDTL